MSRLRILIKMESADAYELKAQALNKDARLKEAGIAALKFTGDKLYIADGEFSTEPPSTTPSAEPDKPKPDTASGKLRVILRMSNEDSYELKAKALNNDPRLKEAGIAAIKFVGDKLYISDGDFSTDLPSPKTEQEVTVDKKVRVTLRVPRKDAYELISKYLNNDPELIKAGISGMELAKGAGMVPVAKEMPARPRKKKRNFVRYLVATVIIGIIGGTGALFLSNPPVPTPTTAPLIPVSGPTETDTPVPATETNLPPTATTIPTMTMTKLPTATDTQLPTATVLSCQPPSEAVVVAENLSCRYGPGAVYLYRAGLLKGEVVDVLGKSDTAYGTWIRVQTRWDQPAKCWVNSDPKYIEIPQGDVACLEELYPEKAPLILFNTNLFPKPSNVQASRSGDLVYIDWQGYDLQPGDRPDASPPYLTETWTCQNGKIVFSPQGWDDTSAFVRDEGGCAEASYGYVYMAHVDGYIGPVTIPWPP